MTGPQASERGGSLDNEVRSYNPMPLRPSTGKTDSDYDFIHRSTNDLSKAAEGHKSEAERMQAVIEAWSSSPEAAEMER